ncbi:MAG: phosphoribosyl-AMP cyclohydrolase [Candidatus Bathyarchaeota archaeon]
MLQLKPEDANKIAKQLNYRHNGLILAVTQDVATQDVLMVAFANKEAVEKALTTGIMHYWSTERKRLWQKGEISGHHQVIEEVYVDCDLDALLVKVNQVDGSCHLGYRTCFFRKLQENKFKITEVLKWKTLEEE